MTVLSVSCSNHIDTYQVQLDSLEILPNNFYAYRGGGVYLTDLKAENYRIWFNLDDNGNVQDVSKIENFRNKNDDLQTVIHTYAIDTSASKAYAQTFIELSRKYRFGHLLIDKTDKISFSYKDGLPEQYVRTLNDSVKNLYLTNKDFRLLENGWFENVEH